MIDLGCKNMENELNLILPDYCKQSKQIQFSFSAL